MRIEMNQRLAKRNRQAATYLFLLTMLVLVGSFILVNWSLFTQEAPNALLLLAQAAALPAAFVLTLVSVRMTNLWAREPRPEDALAEGLKGLSKKSVLYHYHHFPARHVLIAPQGVFVIIAPWHMGKFRVEGDQWRSNQGFFGRLLGLIRMDGLGNPTRTAQRATDHIQRLLQDIAPDVEVQSLIVFVDPRAEVEIIDSSIPVLYSDPKRKPNLKDYMRNLNRAAGDDSKKADLPLSQDQLNEFEKKTLPS